MRVSRLPLVYLDAHYTKHLSSLPLSCFLSLPTESDTDVPAEVKELEVEGVRAAEMQEIDEAIEIFSKAIQLCPRRASGYNNRAQALRIKGDVERKRNLRL